MHYTRDVGRLLNPFSDFSGYIALLLDGPCHRRRDVIQLGNRGADPLDRLDGLSSPGLNRIDLGRDLLGGLSGHHVMDRISLGNMSAFIL